MSKVWFITGAGRSMGTDIAKAALAAGNEVLPLAGIPTRWPKHLVKLKTCWL
jgi:NAD(P)-dependent dehydrogenase (short-subunit alcohol dehydrogenase family)